MRCQAAHPGEAPSTEFNLLSFFSDTDQIILSNPNLDSRSRLLERATRHGGLQIRRGRQIAARVKAGWDSPRAQRYQDLG